MILRYVHFLLLAAATFNVSVASADFPDWPLTPPPPKVDPLPKVEPISEFSKGKLYVVLHNGDPCQLLCSPPGVVAIREYKGAVTIDGIFADSKDGESETRDYSAKQIFRVKRLQPGAFELLKVPAGPVERRLLSDTVPQPLPPGPGPSPGPGPNPPPGPAPSPAKTLRVIFAVESGDTPTSAQQGVIYGVAVENWLLKNCTGGKDGYAIRDKDNPLVEGKEMVDIWNAARPQIKKTPVVIVAKDSNIEIIDLEPTPEKMIEVLNEYLSGKRGK